MEAKFKNMTVLELQELRNEFEEKVRVICTEFKNKTDLEIIDLIPYAGVSSDRGSHLTNFTVKIQSIL